MKTLNVIRAGVTGFMTASLLAACADGRGMGGFKSWKSTPEQRAEWLAKNTPADDKPADTNTTDTDNKGTIDPKTLQEGPGTDTGEKPPTDTPASEKPAGTDTPETAQDLLHEFPNEEAKTQILTELNTNPAEDPNQQLVVNQADLIQANGADLNGGENATAKSLILGISIYVAGQMPNRTVSIDAVVKIGADVRALYVEQAPVNKVTSAGQTLNIPIKLKAVDTEQEVQQDGKVYVMGTCEDTACNSVQVRIEFTLADGTKTAAVFLAQLQAEGFNVTHSNIGQFKTFDVAFAEVGGKAAPVTDQPATEDKSGTTTGDQPAATPEKTAEQLAAERDLAVRNGALAEWEKLHPDYVVPGSTDKPAVDVGNVTGVVNGADSVTAKPVDQPGVGVLDPNSEAARRELAIRNGSLAEFEAQLRLEKERDLAIRNGALAEWEAAQKAKTDTLVTPGAPANPPATDAAAAARAKYEAQKKSGHYPGAGAAVQPKLTTQSAEDLAIRNGALSEWQAKKAAAEKAELARQAQLRRYEAQKKAGAYRGATAK